jgi:hypothetical protein
MKPFLDYVDACAYLVQKVHVWCIEMWNIPYVNQDMNVTLKASLGNLKEKLKNMKCRFEGRRLDSLLMWSPIIGMLAFVNEMVCFETNEQKKSQTIWLAQKITHLHIHLLDMGNAKLARVQLKSHKDIQYIICNLDFEWASCDCPWAQMFFMQAINFVLMKL